VLYLDRPCWAADAGVSMHGRFRYSDLKEAALSGASALWALNVGELLLEGWEPWVCV
jgi:hypothetical protein